MVIFDFVSLMLTLSINANLFLNQIFSPFLMDCKNTSGWASWCWPILQKLSQFLISSRQSGNPKTELRSPSPWIFTKPLAPGKPKILWDAKWLWQHTQIFVCPFSKISFMWPLCQTFGVHQLTKSGNHYLTIVFWPNLCPLGSSAVQNVPWA